MDAHGDALGVAHLPGDRWRRSQGTVKFQFYLDARFPGIEVESEVYGLFTHHHSAQGRTAYGNLSELELKLIQTHMTQKTVLRVEVGACRFAQLSEKNVCKQSCPT